MGSADPTCISVFVLGMIIADTVAALIEWEGDAIGADGWRPPSTIRWFIPILVAFIETATSAIDAAAPLPVISVEGFAAADAILFG